MPAPHITAEQLIQHQPWLFRFVRQLVRDDFTADDVVQTTFTRAIEDHSAGKHNLRAWLATAAKRTIFQEWRSQSRRQQREQKVAISDQVILNQSSQLTALFEIVNRALQELPEQERIVLMLRQMQNLKPALIAKEMDLPTERIYQLQESGIQKLRHRLNDCYGKRWREGCLAILGLPLPTASPSILTPLATAGACLALLFGGAWAFNLFPTASPKLALASAPGKLDFTPLAVLAAPDLSSAQPARVLLPAPPAAAPRVFHFQALGPDDRPLAGATISLSWKNGTLLGTGSVSGSTLADGRVDLTPSLGADSLLAWVSSPGLFIRECAVPLSAEGELTTLRLEQGSIPVSFQTATAQAGIILVVITSTGLRGTCVTDASGHASIPLPTSGWSRVRNQESTLSSPAVEFYVDARGSLEPIFIPNSFAKEFHLTAVRQQTNHVLSDASFSVHRCLYDENGRPTGFLDLPLASNTGTLEFNESMPALGSDWLHVQASGFLDTFLLIKDTEGDLLAPMPALEDVPAVVQLPDPARIVTSLTLYRSVQALRLPVSANAPASSWAFPNSPTQLPVSTAGDFLFPRIVSTTSPSFYLEATDDLGKTWLSPTLGQADTVGSALSFTMLDAAEGNTTVQIFGSKPASLSVTYTSLVESRPALPSQLMYPDQEGILHLKINAGESLHLEYREPALHISLHATPPSNESHAHYDLALPQRNALLDGQIFGPDGLAFPDGEIIATYLDPLPLQGPGAPEAATAYFNLSLRQGRATMAECFPGHYLLHCFFHGLPVELEVNTAEFFDFRMPAVDLFSMKIQDLDTHEAVGARLIRAHLRNGEWRTHLATAKAESGFLSCAIYIPSDPDGLLLVAPSYEPLPLRNMLTDGTLNQVFMKSGRSVDVDLAAWGLSTPPNGFWLLEDWGSVEDPRQTQVQNLGNGLLHVAGAPLANFILSARDSQNLETGNAIRIYADGRQEVL